MSHPDAFSTVPLAPSAPQRPSDFLERLRAHAARTAQAFTVLSVDESQDTA